MSVSTRNIYCKAPSKLLSSVALMNLIMGLLFYNSSTAKQHKVAEIDITGAISPDGGFLTYTDWSSGDLAMLNLETGEKTHLTQKGSWSASDEFALFSTISPTKDQVAYAWFNKNGFYDVRLIGFDDSKPRIFYSNKEIYPIPMQWSTDGKNILAVLELPDKKHQIVVISIADGTVRVLEKLSWRYPLKVSFSPDGRHIAYDLPPTDDSPGRDIYLSSTNGGQRIALVQHPANDLLLGWSADGQHVLFASDRSGTLDAWSIQVSDGQPYGTPKLCASNIGPNVVALGFTKNNDYFFGVEIHESDLYVAAFDSSQSKLQPAPTRISSVGTNTVPDWSPDGRSLSYIQHSGAAPYDLYSSSVVIHTHETGDEYRLVPKLRQWHKFILRWSLDGRSLLAQARGQQNIEGVYQIDRQTGEVFSLAWSETGCPDNCLEWPSWVDSEKIAYTRLTLGDEGSRDIVIRNINTGEEKELYHAMRPNQISELTVSRAGRLLAFLWSDGETGATAVKVVPIRGGEAKELIRIQLPEKLLTLAWMPDGRHILFGKQRSSGKQREFEIWQISVNGDEPRTTGLVIAGQRLYGISVHPDGRYVAFTAGHPLRREVWMIQDFLSEP